MRIHTHDGKPGFLGYCANVHPGESLPDVLHAVRQLASGVRTHLAVDQLSLGLWLSQRSAAELAARGCGELSQALRDAGIFVVTLNGFPYGNFHAEVVKRQVYHPDLCSPERRAYLSQLAQILAELLPPDAAEGSISTLPIGHRAEPLDLAGQPQSPATREVASAAAAAQLCELAKELAELRARTGKSIRICLEPEPGCWLETTADAVQFFSHALPEAAHRCGVRAATLSQHLGLCYDTCHQAIAFEDAAQSIRDLTQAGITIGKAQLSSAIEVPNPADPAALAQLATFEEPRFLHQVRARKPDGTLWAADDLAPVAALPTTDPLRVHFHVPIHRESVGNIATTRPFLLAALAQLTTLEHVPHLEVETYTWSVLPAAERPKNDAELTRGLANEIAFVRSSLM
jgi:sugar phosphate isomerase/epimerase